MRREGDDGGMFTAAFFYFANNPRGFKAVHTWHLRIHQNEVKTPSFGRGFRPQVEDLLS